MRAFAVYYVTLVVLAVGFLLFLVTAGQVVTRSPGV
jgi:hypothetical protein